MKNALLLALVLGGAALDAPAALAQTTPQSKKEMKRKEKARKRNGPEVYKGSVAEQRRLVTDAPGAENESDEGGDDATKAKKAKRKN